MGEQFQCLWLHEYGEITLVVHLRFAVVLQTTITAYHQLIITSFRKFHSKSFLPTEACMTILYEYPSVAISFLKFNFWVFVIHESSLLEIVDDNHWYRQFLDNIVPLFWCNSRNCKEKPFKFLACYWSNFTRESNEDFDKERHVDDHDCTVR